MVACYLGLIIASAGLAIAVWPAWLGSIMLSCFALALITFLPGRQPLPRGTRSLERIHNPELDRAVNIACEATGARPPDFVAMTIVPGVFPIRMGFGIWPRVGVAIGFPVWDAAPPEGPHIASLNNKHQLLKLGVSVHFLPFFQLSAPLVSRSFLTEEEGTHFF